MPYKKRQIGKYLVSVSPSGFKRNWGKRPFFTGDDVSFNLHLELPVQSKYEDSFVYQWELFDKVKRELKNKGEDTFIFSNTHKALKQKNRNYHYSNTNVSMWFVKPKAINVGELWDMHTYDLYINKSLVVEFTLQDEQYDALQQYYNLRTLLSSVIAAVITSIITWLILGRLL